MRFSRKINPDIEPFYPKIELGFELSDGNEEILTNSGLCNIDIDLSINFEKDPIPEEILLELSQRGSITPPKRAINEEEFEDNFSIYTDPDERISVRIFFKNNETWAGPIELSCPSYQTCTSCRDIIFEHSANEQLDNLCEIYNKSGYPSAVFSLLKQVKGWIPLDVYYLLLNTTADLSPEVSNEIDSDNTVGFLCKQLTVSDNYEFESRLQLEQVVQNINMLPSLPNIELFEVIGGALSIIEQNSNIDGLWEFEKKYEIARDNWEEILRDDQFPMLLGRATVERNFSHAHHIIESWIGSSEDIRDIGVKFEKAREANGNTSLDLWRSTLRYAIEEPPSTLEYAVAGFLNQFHHNKNVKKIYTKEEICRCSSILYDRHDIDELSLYMEYNYYELSGRRHRKQDQLEKAEAVYQDYFETGIECVQNDVSGATLDWPIYQLYRAKANIYQTKKNYQAAIDSVNEGKDLLESTNLEADEEFVQDKIRKLEALQQEILGEKELENGNLNPAYGHFGKAIGVYTEKDMFSARKYLKQRRKLIEASLAEREGDFQSAKEAHEAVVELTDDTKFKQFNRARIDITETKQHLVDLNIEKARESLPTHLHRSNVARVESLHIGSLLDVIGNYKNDEIQNVKYVLNKFRNHPDFSEMNDPFPFDYGHDYRPVIVNALAAQRLRRLPIGEVLLDELLEISIKQVLSPEKGRQQVVESGLGGLELRSRWKHYFPLHIVRRYQELREKEIGGGDNYIDEGLGLLKLVEQSLELSGDYYAQKEFGADWAERFAADEGDNNRLNLKALRDLLNTDPMEDVIWEESVQELIDEPLIGESSLIEARNALGHDRISRISKEEYNNILERVETILTRIVAEVPIVVTSRGQSEVGLEELTAHWENPQKTIRIKTEKTLKKGGKYYLPLENQTLDPIFEINADKIMPVQADRVSDNLSEYMGD